MLLYFQCKICVLKQNLLRTLLYVTVYDLQSLTLCCPLLVCLQPVKKKHRARVLEFFIDVAQECFNIGNFNSLMAIISEYILNDIVVNY